MQNNDATPARGITTPPVAGRESATDGPASPDASGVEGHANQRSESSGMAMRGVAQLEEYASPNGAVVGSNPTPSLSPEESKRGAHAAPIARIAGIKPGPASPELLAERLPDGTLIDYVPRSPFARKEGK